MRFFPVYKVPVYVGPKNKINKNNDILMYRYRYRMFNNLTVWTFNTFVFLLTIDRFCFSGTGVIIIPYRFKVGCSPTFGFSDLT